MTWAHLVNETMEKTEIHFDAQLLEQIEHKNNSKVKLTLKVAKDLYRAVDDSGNSLLHYAAKFANETITSYLIKLGAKLNVENKDGDTPLLLATKLKNAAIMKILLKSNADICVCNKNGESAVQIALQMSPIDFEIAIPFLQRVSTDCSSDHTEISEVLMRINCPLFVAVLLKNVNVTTCMLSEGSSINAKDPKTKKTALHFAVENVDFAHVQKLLFLGADVTAIDAMGKPPLALISDFSNADEALSIVKILLNQTRLTACDIDGFMHMRSILQNGTVDAVSKVLRRLSSFTVTDRRKQNIIHYLAGNYRPGILEVIKHLKIFMEVNLNAREKFGLTALHCAMHVGNVDFVEFLVSKDVNLHILSKVGASPLMQVVVPMSQNRLEQRVECARILLRNKAQPDIFMGNYLKARDNELDVDLDYPLIEPAVATLAVWKAVDRPFNRGILKKINSYTKLKRLFVVCTNELEKMRGEKVDRNVTVLDMLGDYDDFECTRHSMLFLFGGWRVKRVIEKYRSNSTYYEFLDNRVRRVMIRKKEDLWTFMMVCCLVGVMIGAFVLFFASMYCFFKLLDIIFVGTKKALD